MEQKKKEKIAEHLRTIAEQEGITESEVRNEIAYAVALALKSNNPKIQNFWKNIPSLDAILYNKINPYLNLNYCKE